MALRVAVIGAGYIGNQHLEAYHSCAGAEIAAVCDLVKAKADAAVTKYGRHCLYIACGTAEKRTVSMSFRSVQRERRTVRTTSGRSCSAWRRANTSFAKSRFPTN